MHQLIEEALPFAAVLHDGQFRKGTNVPYLTHPVAVSMLLVEDRQPVPVVAAGLLHDLLDDTLTTAEEIEERFGSEVRRLVQAVSEPNKHLSWEERKRMTIQHVHRCSMTKWRFWRQTSYIIFVRFDSTSSLPVKWFDLLSYRHVLFCRSCFHYLNNVQRKSRFTDSI